MRVDINLATHPYEDSGSLWVRWGGALAVLEPVHPDSALQRSCRAGLSARKDRNLIEQRQQQIAARDQEKSQSGSNSQSAGQSQHARPCPVSQRSVPAQGVFLDQGVRRSGAGDAGAAACGLNSASHGTDNQLEIKLVVAGESRERALELVRKMESSQRFQQTQIQQESSEAGQTPGDNVQFDISAVYVPDLPGVEPRSTP